MSCKILINAIDPEECRIAKVIDSRLEEFQIQSAAREILQGNIYKGIVARIEPSLQAVFVDFGHERHGFLQKHEIHSDYFQAAASPKRSIRQLVKRGQELLVQVTKDPVMKKGAMLTTMISLPGRHLVLMPGSSNRGISRKIADEEERQRLKGILDKLNIPEGFGVIVRTAGEKSTKTQLQKDLRYLLRLWKNIKQKGIKEKAPALLYRERSLALRSIRDYFTPDTTEILIDNESVFQEVKNFIHIVSPKHQKIVKLYTADKPIFTKHRLEEQIATIFDNRVNLKSGGSIVITPTEALVAVDVNSGKATQKRDLEQTALQTNLEAAEEIARQLRLRDLGGLIVIDFIDMRDSQHRLQVERSMRNQTRQDKARITVGRISRFGLLEMSRQRLAPPIDFSSLITCPHCAGRGLVPSTETLALRVLRQLKLETLKESLGQVQCRLPTNVADYLLNKKRRELAELESRRNLSIVIQADPELFPGQCHIECRPESCSSP